jgi:hypothetical protein
LALEEKMKNPNEPKVTSKTEELVSRKAPEDPGKTPGTAEGGAQEKERPLEAPGKTPGRAEG